MLISQNMTVFNIWSCKKKQKAKENFTDNCGHISPKLPFATSETDNDFKNE